MARIVFVRLEDTGYIPFNVFNVSQFEQAFLNACLGAGFAFSANGEQLSASNHHEQINKIFIPGQFSLLAALDAHFNVTRVPLDSMFRRPNSDPARQGLSKMLAAADVPDTFFAADKITESLIKQLSQTLLSDGKTLFAWYAEMKAIFETDPFDENQFTSKMAAYFFSPDNMDDIKEAVRKFISVALDETVAGINHGGMEAQFSKTLKDQSESFKAYHTLLQQLIVYVTPAFVTQNVAASADHCVVVSSLSSDAEDHDKPVIAPNIGFQSLKNMDGLLSNDRYLSMLIQQYLKVGVPAYELLFALRDNNVFPGEADLAQLREKLLYHPVLQTACFEALSKDLISDHYRNHFNSLLDAIKQFEYGPGSKTHNFLRQAVGYFLKFCPEKLYGSGSRSLSISERIRLLEMLVFHELLQKPAQKDSADGAADDRQLSEAEKQNIKDFLKYCRYVGLSEGDLFQAKPAEPLSNEVIIARQLNCDFLAKMLEDGQLAGRTFQFLSEEQVFMLGNGKLPNIQPDATSVEIKEDSSGPDGAGSEVDSLLSDEDLPQSAAKNFSKILQKKAIIAELVKQLRFVGEDGQYLELYFDPSFYDFNPEGDCYIAMIAVGAKVLVYNPLSVRFEQALAFLEDPKWPEKTLGRLVFEDSAISSALDQAFIAHSVPLDKQAVCFKIQGGVSIVTVQGLPGQIVYCPDPSYNNPREKQYNEIDAQLPVLVPDTNFKIPDPLLDGIRRDVANIISRSDASLAPNAAPHSGDLSSREARRAAFFILSVLADLRDANIPEEWVVVAVALAKHQQSKDDYMTYDGGQANKGQGLSKFYGFICAMVSIGFIYGQKNGFRAPGADPFLSELGFSKILDILLGVTQPALVGSACMVTAVGGYAAFDALGHLGSAMQSLWSLVRKKSSSLTPDQARAIQHGMRSLHLRVGAAQEALLALVSGRNMANDSKLLEAYTRLANTEALMNRNAEKSLVELEMLNGFQKPGARPMSRLEFLLRKLVSFVGKVLGSAAFLIWGILQIKNLLSVINSQSVEETESALFNFIAILGAIVDKSLMPVIFYIAWQCFDPAGWYHGVRRSLPALPCASGNPCATFAASARSVDESGAQVQAEERQGLIDDKNQQGYGAT